MRKQTKIILILILFVGYILRSYNSFWDMGFNLHPDERAIIMTVLDLSLPDSFESFFSVESTLNPHFFAYGNMPFYVLKIAASAYAVIDPTIDSYYTIAPLARAIVVLVELCILLTLFFHTRKLFSEQLALIATTIYAIAVFPIQVAHFFTVDPFMSLFILLTLTSLISMYRHLSYKNSLAVGLFFGLALASKISALPLIFPISITVICIIYKHQKRLSIAHLLRTGMKIFPYILTLGLSAVGIYAITQPYVILDFQSFLAQSKIQSQMTESAFTFPYTLQYVGKIPYWYEVKNIFLWGFGPVATVLMVIGIAVTIKDLRNASHQIEKMIMFSFVGIYFLIVGNFAVGWMRYMLPLYPFFAIFAAIGISTIFRKLSNNATVQKSIVALMVCLLLLWPASFLHIYTMPHTRLAATDWIIKNIPEGSTLAVEHWDDRLPLHGGERYTTVDLPLYDPDTPFKWNTINHTLDTTDYIIIASNRLYTPLQKMTTCEQLPPDKCYPTTAAYYRDLFNGSRGFEKIKEFSVYPTIPYTNIHINDQGADESFTVYDHPKIFIFKKNDSIPHSR